MDVREGCRLAKKFPLINQTHREFISRQHIFFVASAAGQSHVNLSPRSTDSLRLIDDHEVAYLDRTGSSNETAAHIRASGSVTIMFCAFEGTPLILRLYGKGVVHHRRSKAFAELLAGHFGGVAPLGTRQIVSLKVEMVQSSCGFGVPLFAYEGERDALDKWAGKKGQEGLEAYWHDHNVESLDGLPTGLLEDCVED
jgi:hypothetical protein